LFFERKILRVLLASFLWSVAVSCVSAGVLAQEIERAEQIKAAFFLKFSNFVERKGQGSLSMASSEATTMCILGNDPFGEVIDKLASIRRSNPKGFLIRRIKTPAFDQCDFAYVSASEASRLESIIQAANETTVVTVSDIPGFVRAGGIIELFLDGNNIRFKINRFHALEQGIEISSHLLSLATEVVEGKDGVSGRE
jgi:hypothetical protein